MFSPLAELNQLLLRFDINIWIPYIYMVSTAEWSNHWIRHKSAYYRIFKIYWQRQGQVPFLKMFVACFQLLYWKLICINAYFLLSVGQVHKPKLIFKLFVFTKSVKLGGSVPVSETSLYPDDCWAKWCQRYPCHLTLRQPSFKLLTGHQLTFCWIEKFS